jgi:hypothetical protein
VRTWNLTYFDYFLLVNILECTILLTFSKLCIFLWSVLIYCIHSHLAISGYPDEMWLMVKLSCFHALNGTHSWKWNWKPRPTKVSQLFHTSASASRISMDLVIVLSTT